VESNNYYGSFYKENWIYILDGTRFILDYDLTVTTFDGLKMVNTVNFEGVLAINKDIGAGYFYNVLLETAKLKK
jgi:hypothetical protein